MDPFEHENLHREQAKRQRVPRGTPLYDTDKMWSALTDDQKRMMPNVPTHHQPGMSRFGCGILIGCVLCSYFILVGIWTTLRGLFG